MTGISDTAALAAIGAPPASSSCRPSARTPPPGRDRRPRTAHPPGLPRGAAVRRDRRPHRPPPDPPHRRSALPPHQAAGRLQHGRHPRHRRRPRHAGRGGVDRRRRAGRLARGLRYWQDPSAHRPGPGRLRAGPPCPLRHHRPAGQRAGRGRRPAAAVPHRRALRPPRPAPARRARLRSARSPRRRAALLDHHRTGGTSLYRHWGRICRSANGEPCSPTPGSSPPSSTASPSTPTSWRPAPSPTGSPPARPAVASQPASLGMRSDADH
jgi:hypothetical protein